MIPKLRFKREDGTDYPEWDCISLKDVVSDFIVPMRDKPKEFDGDVDWCRIEDIENGFINGSLAALRVSNEVITSMNLKVLPIGSVIVSCSAYLGVCARVTKPLITNQTFIGLVPNDSVTTDFIYHLMTTKERILNRLSSGTTISYLARSEFERLNIQLPRLDEQQKIASLFNAIDQKINLLTKKKEALETYKKGLMQKIFSQELRFKREDGTDYPEWISVKLGDLFEIGSSKRILQEFWQNEGVPFLRTRELVSIHNRKPFSSPIFISRQTYEEIVNNYGKPKVGDILCAGVGSIGHFVRVDESFGDFYFKDGNVLIMSPRDNISTDFFLLLLYSSQIQKKIHSQSSITTVATFTITDAKRLKVLIPESSEERLQIAELLEGITKRINLTEDKIANVLELKKGLLQQMFV